MSTGQGFATILYSYIVIYITRNLQVLFDPLELDTDMEGFCTINNTMCMIATRLRDERSVKWMNKTKEVSILQRLLNYCLAMSFLQLARIVG